MAEEKPAVWTRTRAPGYWISCLPSEFSPYRSLLPRAWTFFHTFFSTTRGIAQPMSFLDLTNDKVRTWKGARFILFLFLL